MRLILSCIPSASVSFLSFDSHIIPLSIRRKNLAFRFIFKSINQSNDNFISNLIHVFRRWRFTFSRVPLLAAAAYKFRKYRNFILALPSTSRICILLTFLDIPIDISTFSSLLLPHSYYNSLQ